MTERDEEQASTGRGQLEQDAATWCVRMHGHDKDRWREEFEAWLRRGALHRRAYNRMEEVYLLGERARWPSDAVSSAPKAIGSTRRPVRVAIGAALATGAALALAAAVLLTGHTRAPGPGAPSPALASLPEHARIAATSAGPARFALADGSSMTLFNDSVAQIGFNETVRTITLERGSGRFMVARGTRLFIVRAGGGAVTARGTQFDVAYASARRVQVHLLEGEVDVAFPAAAGTAAPVTQRVVRLRPGQRVAFPVAPVGPREPPPAFMPAGDAQPDTVGDLIDLANATPGAPVRVELEDASLRAIRLSGSFRVHDPRTVADRLVAMLGLELDRSRPGVLLLRRPSRR